MNENSGLQVICVEDLQSGIITELLGKIIKSVENPDQDYFWQIDEQIFIVAYPEKLPEIADGDDRKLNDYRTGQIVHIPENTLDVIIYNKK